MRVKICGSIQEMAAEEVLRSVSALDYKRIKQADPNPKFSAYCIGHEGESSGKILGIGKVIKKWARATIEKLTDKLAIGTKIFHMHGPDTNEHDGRKPIGEIIGKVLSDVAGKLSSIAITYIYPEYRDVPLDVASIEADIILPETINPNARSVDVDVEDITAIALGNSQINKPGFAGATLLACLQEFAESANHEKSPKGDKPMTKDEIRQAIRDLKLSLSDIFSPKEIADDSIVQDVIREKRRNEEGFEGRQSAKLEGQVKQLEQDKKDLQAKLDATSKVTLKVKAAEAFKPAIEKRKLDEKQSAFILKHADKFEPKSEESLAGDLDKFLDTKIDELKGFHDLYGIKPGESGQANIGAGKADDNSAWNLLMPDTPKDEPKK